MLAKESIASGDLGNSFELQSTIRRIRFLDSEIDVFDTQIKTIMDEVGSPIMTIPGISYTLAAVIISEIGSIDIFACPAKLQAFAGLDPSTYQSGNYTATHARMVKHGSKYLRRALMLSANYVRIHESSFGAVYNKKRAEGKHHYVALSHVAKKLIRVIFHLMSAGEDFVHQAA